MLTLTQAQLKAIHRVNRKAETYTIEPSPRRAYAILVTTWEGTEYKQAEIDREGRIKLLAGAKL